MKTDAELFIRQNTSVIRPPHVPEIQLFLASEAHDLWLKTEDELDAIGLPPPYWAFAWAGGQGLSRYILDHPHVVRGKRVIDFASGSGLVAIAAKLSGALTVDAIDIDHLAGTAIEMNALLNGVDVNINRTDIIGNQLDVDVLLAGDVFYDREFAALLFPWLQELAKSGVEILVGDPGRAYLPKSNLIARKTYEVPVTRELEDAEVKRTTVWQIA